MLRALLLQLCFQVPGLTADLESLKGSYKDSLPPVPVLLNLIKRIADRCRHLYIVLDALDESPAGSPREEVLTLIETVRQWRSPGLHLLVTSRDIPEIRDLLVDQEVQQVPLNNSQTQQDIADYISSRISHDRQLQRLGDQREKVKSYLIQHANGV